MFSLYQRRLCRSGSSEHVDSGLREEAICLQGFRAGRVHVGVAFTAGRLHVGIAFTVERCFNHWSRGLKSTVLRRPLP